MLDLDGCLLKSKFCLKTESLSVKRPTEYYALYSLEMGEETVTATKLPFESVSVLEFVSDSIFAVRDKGAIQVNANGWKTLPKMEGTVTDLSLRDSAVLAVDDKGTILSFTDSETETYTTKMAAPHFFSLDSVVAVTKESFLIFDLKGNLQGKQPNSFNILFSLYKNNPDYAVLSYEDHILVWDHVFKTTKHLNLYSPLLNKQD